MVNGIKKFFQQPTTKWITKFLITAGLYLVLGKIGSFITISPGNFSALWVPSGLALGAIILFRNPAILAVVITSLIINQDVFANQSQYLLTLSMTLLITFQAVTGAELIKRRIKLVPPDNVKDTIQFIGIITLTSFVTALIGTLLLVAFQIKLPFTPWLFGSIWVTGSIISTFTITPILLPLYDRLRIRERKAQFNGVFASLIISFTFFLVFITWISETDRVNSQFQEDSREIISVIKSQFQKEIESIQGIKAFFNASDVVERDEFNDFTKSYLENSESTISLAWLPIIESYELTNFERQIHDEGFSDYQVFELSPTLNKLKVSSRDVYYPVTYFAAESMTENNMGFDFGSNSSLLRAINMAQEIGAPISTEPINLQLSQADKEDIYVIVPVQGKSRDSISENVNNRNLIGFGAGSFDVEKTINLALEKIKGYDIALYVFDTSFKNSPIFITYHPSISKASYVEQSKGSPISILFEENAYREEFGFFGRTWTFISFPAKEYAFRLFPNYSLMVLFIGLILLIAYLINLSNNEKNQDRIRKSESMFRSLSDSALTGIVRVRPNGEILYANDTLAFMFGFDTTVDFARSNFFELFENTDEVIKSVESLKNGSSLLNKHFRIINQKSNPRDILVSAGYYDDMFSANIVDITNINQLNKEVQQLNHAVRQMADTVFITDAKGIIEYVNPAFALITGYSYLDSVGKHIKQIKKSTTHDLAHIFNWDSMLDGNPHEFEFQTRLKNFELITEFISISPITNSQGKIIQYVGSGKDITELKKAKEEILELNSNLEKRVIQRTSELEKAKKEMEAFSYTVSHDLRAPLRNMHGYSSILLEDYAKSIDSTALTYLKNIQKASIKMDNLIQELLKLSHISNSKCIRKKVDLIDLANEIIQNLKNEDPSRKVTFKLPDSITVWADADLITIALNNLIRNAWKFTKNQEDAIIEFGSYFDEDEQVIFVKDNGVGFDMAFQNKLFGVFQRLHRDEEFEGTGIGLATVKRIIDHHEGRVWAKGEINKGATFFFTIGTLEE